MAQRDSAHEGDFVQALHLFECFNSVFFIHGVFNLVCSDIKGSDGACLDFLNTRLTNDNGSYGTCLDFLSARLMPMDT